MSDVVQTGNGWREVVMMVDDGSGRRLLDFCIATADVQLSARVRQIRTFDVMRESLLGLVWVVVGMRGFNHWMMVVDVEVVVGSLLLLLRRITYLLGKRSAIWSRV